MEIKDIYEIDEDKIDGIFIKNILALAGTRIYMSDPEALYLYKNIMTIKSKSYIEIGTWEGGSASIVGLAAKKIAKKNNINELEFKITCIDTFKSSNKEGFGDLHGRDTLDIFKNTIEKLELNNIVEYHIGLSNSVSKNICYNIYDNLLIDGDHEYDGVKSDYEEYKDKVRKGGNILFHDYNICAGVNKFLDELKSKGEKIIPYSHTLWGLVKE